MGWMARIQFAAGERDFSVLHSNETSSGVYKTSYPMGTSFFPWGKAARE
jgi:hypothetical protein